MPTMRQFLALALCFVAACSSSGKPAAPRMTEMPAEVATAMKELFEAYESRNIQRFLALLDEQYRTVDDAGMVQGYARLADAVSADFENLDPIQFQVSVLESAPSDAETIRVQIRWSRRAQARMSGQEWLDDNHIASLHFRVPGADAAPLLTSIEGEAPFGVSGLSGAISVASGIIDGKSPGPDARIHMGTFIP